MTHDDALTALSLGETSLRRVAARWGLTMPSAYARLYGRPMPPPARPPHAGRVLAMPPRRRGRGK